MPVDPMQRLTQSGTPCSVQKRSGSVIKITSASMLVLLIGVFLSMPQVLAAREREVRVPWEELAPLVEGRDVETVLTNGVYVRGRAQKVLHRELEVRVKRTSDAAVIPKGETRIPRELLGALTVKSRKGPARVLLPPAMVFGVSLTLSRFTSIEDHVSSAVWYPIAIGTGIAGYLLGRRLDTQSMRIIVTPTHSQRSEVAERSDYETPE
ncbi:MAG TPA: hypothetical protein VFQ79_17250 [Bryobacteraceae bacterium]|nr:hypothetical protein [Bryobacteraceae bacterium]